MSVFKKSCVIGSITFLCLMLLVELGFIEESTVYHVVIDTKKYGSLVAMILIIVGIMVYIIVYKVSKGPGDGLAAVGVSGIIVFIYVYAVLLCISLMMLFIFADTINCEIGIISRGVYGIKEMRIMINNLWLYRSLFSGSLSIAMVMFYNMIRIGIESLKDKSIV